MDDTSRNTETVDHSLAMETEDVAELRKPSLGKKKGRKRKQRGRGSGSGDARSPSRSSKRKFTEVRDPYQFTDSQSNRVQSPLKQRGDDLMVVASKTKTEPDRLEKRKSPRSSRRRGASSAERERTRGGNGVKEGGNKEEQKGDPSSEKENQGGVEQSGSKVTRSESRRTLSFVRQSSSSSSSGHQQHVSRMTLQDDTDMEIKYEVVTTHLKMKKVYIREYWHTPTPGNCQNAKSSSPSSSDRQISQPDRFFLELRKKLSRCGPLFTGAGSAVSQNFKCGW
ncbi:hypothetical protein BSL78_19446 [Apostichopus japonicus]|uniref:Uncharacterized protein n=1 Tax=Stichopus japonicus TaxID=307972 RepID=A0A2G8K6W3_STIJA|nr:hypothetical protein BSL78_19446 [Apostichopus japonicus]